MFVDKRRVTARVVGAKASANLREHRSAVVLILLLGLVAVTHDTFANGPAHFYIIQIAKQAHFIIAVYVLSYWLRRQRRATLSCLAVAIAVSVTLLLTFQHTFRLLHPARWGVVYAELRDDFRGPVIAEGRWRILGDDTTSIRVHKGTLHLTPPPAMQAFVELLLPNEPTSPAGQRWLPVGLYDAAYEEELTWRGAVQVEREYFVVLVWNMLLVQRTPYGLHITYPDAAGALEGHRIPFTFAEPSQARTWRVLRQSSRVSLAIDGEVVWSADAGQGQLDKLPRFGESRTDALHAGRLTLEWVRYRRWLPRELRLGDDMVLTRIDHMLGGRLGLGHLTVGVSSTDARPPAGRPDR